MRKRKPHPIDKYHFYHNDNQIIAVSTYAGKIVRAAAKADPRDEFDEDYGKRLAAARCNYKVAKKRRAAAKRKMYKLEREMAQLEIQYEKAVMWFNDASVAKYEAADDVIQILAEKSE